MRGMQLQQLADQLPVANQQVAQGMQEGQKTKMLGSLGTSPMLNKNQVAAGGAQMTAEQGKTAGTSAQTLATQQSQVRGMQVEEQQRTGIQHLSDMQSGASELERNQQMKLSSYDHSMKTKLIDEQMQLGRDKAGQTLFNTRQLADWNALNARSQQDYNNRAQIINQAQQRQIAVMQRASDMMKQAVEQGYVANKQQLDEATKKDILQRKQAVDIMISQSQARAANTLAMGQGIGALVGIAAVAAIAISGGTATPLVAAPLAASLGGAAGGSIASQNTGRAI